MLLVTRHSRVCVRVPAPLAALASLLNVAQRVIPTMCGAFVLLPETSVSNSLVSSSSVILLGIIMHKADLVDLRAEAHTHRLRTCVHVYVCVCACVCVCLRTRLRL